MVWEWKCHAIVMLTEVQEREQVSAAPPGRSHTPAAAHLLDPLSLGTAHLPSAVRPGHN